MEIIQAKKENLKKIIDSLRQGMVLVCPTDTVYGLICDAGNEKAVEKIFEIKKREKIKPLAIFVKNLGEAKKIAHINYNQEKFLEKNWPGAVTAVFKAKKQFLSKLVYQNGTIGLRVPNYEFLGRVLKEFGKPIAQTSANISGQPATTKIKEILEQFSAQGGSASIGGAAEIQPDVIINAGDLPENNPSKVVDFSNNKIEILRK